LTTIKRIYFEPSDIRAIQLECGNCNTTISYPLKKWKPETIDCPNCLAALIKGVKEVTALTKLAESLNTLLLLAECDKPRFQLRFELNENSN